MEKEFIPYDLALRLKALGFKERVLTYYEDGKPKLHTAIEGWDFNSSFLTCVSRPTYSQAFRWFREKYHLYGKVETTSLTCHFIMIKEVTLDGTIRESPRYVTYNSYEEAELACLIKLIEIVESKTE